MTTIVGDWLVVEKLAKSGAKKMWTHHGNSSFYLLELHFFLNWSFCQKTVGLLGSSIGCFSTFSFHFWCILGGSVWNIMKSNLFRFMQNEFDPQWTNIDFFHSISTLPPGMHPKLTEHWRYCMQNSQLATKSHVDELEDNFIEKRMRTWTFWSSLIQYPSNICESGIMAMVTWGLPCMKDPLHGGVKPWLKPTCLMRPSNLPDLHRFFHLEEDRQAWPQQSKPEPELPHWALGSQARVPSYHSAKTPNLLGYFNHTSSQKESYRVPIKIRHSHRISLANRVILSNSSTWLVLVESWLFCIQHLPCSVSFRCMLEV